MLLQWSLNCSFLTEVMSEVQSFITGPGKAINGSHVFITLFRQIESIQAGSLNSNLITKGSICALTLEANCSVWLVNPVTFWIITFFNWSNKNVLNVANLLYVLREESDR